jgi:Kef-type K+ transport system membrane component KefB/mannitol/fructose-specific phosphotransferase system IIA component (Ntr-type)
LGLAIPLFASDAGGDEMSMTHKMMILSIQLGLILFCAKIANLAFEKIRLPGALGELVAGALIGPYALGSVLGLFQVHGPNPITPELYGLATVASIVLLFTIGLETDLKLLLRYSVVGSLAGIGGLFVSFAFGAGTVVLFSRMLFGETLSFFAPPCLMLGTITTATSVGITARILSERRKLDSPEGVTILSAAVIDDVLGIILLALVTSYITATEKGGAIDWSHIGLIAGKAVGVWIAATTIGLIASRKISFMLKLFRDRTTIAIMALGLALALAGLFEEAGLAMIVGAYVMGLSLSQSDISHLVREKLTTVYALLVPVFFCVTGMQVNLLALTDWRVLAFGLVYAFAAMLAKLLGCGLPSMLAGFNLRGAARVGFGMAPRCEVALIIAGVSLSRGFLTPEVLAAVIIMVIINTVIAPPILVLLFKNPAPGTRKELPRDENIEDLEFDFPTVEMAEFFVGKLNRLLEAEGFFTHAIDRSLHIYQFRKDDTVIDFQRDQTKLIFWCSRREVPLVDAVMYESLAALEQTLRGLRKPLDATGIQTRIQQAADVVPSNFDIREYLDQACIEPQMRAETKNEAIDELLQLLADSGKLKNIKAARQAVIEREESLSTGLQYGVAIPHARTHAVDKLVCAVGIKKEGIDFAALDGNPSQIFVLTLSPEDRPCPHLQLMSAISQILNESGREKILKANHARQIMRVFTEPVIVSSPAAAAPREPRPKFMPEQFIERELIKRELASSTKEGVIRELIDLLIERDYLDDPTEATRAIMAREEQLSTGLEAGIALPHGRTDSVDRMICAIGTKPEGIDFGSADGKPSKIFLLVLTPTKGVDPYLQFVAWAMGFLGNEEKRQGILDAKDEEEIYQALTQSG